MFFVHYFAQDLLFMDDEDNVEMPDPSEKFEELLTR